MSEVRGNSAPSVDLQLLAQQHAAMTALWAEQSVDLHINLVSLKPGTGIGEHVNAELDVLRVGIAGAGEVSIDGVPHSLRASGAMFIPKGARRAIRCLENSFSYPSCHRRRAMLWPTVVRRSG